MLTQTVQGGASLTLPMSFEEYEALGETKHTAYYDELAHVNPPTVRHVQIVRRLTRVLDDAVPREYEVLPEAGWAVGPLRVLSPDIMVALRSDLDADMLRVAPLLVVEVLSPSTRREDLGRKRELYAQGGAPWYWLVDPESDTVTALELQGTAYVQREILREGVHQVRKPFTVKLDLGRILA